MVNTNQYPVVRPPKIRADKAKIVMRADGVEGIHIGVGDTDARQYETNVPDVYGYVQNRVHLSRSTIFAILDHKENRIAASNVCSGEKTN